MNTGLISSRYAKALLKFSELNGDSEKTCLQARTILKAFAGYDEFRRILDDRAAITKAEKLSIIEASIGNEPMTKSLNGVIQLVLKNERMEYLRFMLLYYVSYYYKSRNIIFAHLYVTVKSKDVEKKLGLLLKDKTGKDVVMDSQIREDLIGGFILVMDDMKIDTSVLRQLDTLKREFINRNRRIV